MKGDKLPTRVLGATGVEVPILGLGTGPGGMGLYDVATRLYHRAIDLGVTYIDAAPGYVNAHAQLRDVLRERRGEVFLATKAFVATGAKLLETAARDLEELGVEQVDLLHVHSLGEQSISEVFAPDGALATLAEVRRRGWARFVGFTAHDRPEVAARAIREASELDVVMLAMNYVDRHVYGFEDRVLPSARKRGLGVAAMKVFAGSVDMKYDKPARSALESRGETDLGAAFRYALSLPGVSVAVVGVYDEGELEQNVAWARSFRPLDAGEAALLDGRGRKAASGWGTRYGPVE